MRIGIDARSLVGNRSGVGYYLTNLLEHGAFGNATVLAYHMEQSEERPVLDIPEMTTLNWRPLPTPRWIEALFRAAHPVWWINIQVRQAMKADGVDAFFGPNFVQPVTSETPSAIVVHDLIHRTYPAAHSRTYRAYLRASLGLALRRTEYVVTVSESSKQDLLRYHSISPEQIEVAYGAADDRFQPRTLDTRTKERLRSEYDLPDRFLLYVGNIEPRKNLSAVIEAIDELPYEEQPPLVIVGEERNVSDAFESAYERCSFQNLIHFPGYVPDRDLPLLYNLGTAFVYPSLYEGFGLPVVEAMQSGTPVIVSDRSSLPEVVGDAGIVVDPEDAKAFAGAIQLVWTDAATRTEYAEQGLERAASFSWEETAETVSSMLGSLHEI